MTDAKTLRRKVGQMTMPVRRKLGVRLPPREQLMQKMPRGSVGAEIGVWRGDFSELILEVVRPKTLHLIDPWEFMGDKSGSIYGGLVAKDQSDMDGEYEAVAARFAREVGRGTVVLHRAYSADAATKVADGSLDWVYIDGDHSYEGVRDDLKAWNAKVRPGGLITGDDYGRAGWWGQGVKKAVDEFVAASNCTMEWRAGAQYALRKPA